MGPVRQNPIQRTVQTAHVSVLVNVALPHFWISGAFDIILLLLLCIRHR